MTNQPKATQSLTKSARTLRITVRGSFEVLTHDQQAELRSRADQHDLLRAHFTEEGHLAYDIDARPFFTYRFLSAGRTDEEVARAVTDAEAATRAALDRRGLPHQLRSTRVQDLAQAPLSKRQRSARA